MNNRREWLILLTIIFAGVVMLPYSPWFQPPPPSDAGVFQYMGAQILAGKLPYRDVFDHKPPVVYYLNALGLAIIPGSMWGIWLVEVAMVCLSAGLATRLLVRVWGSGAAAFGTIGGLFILSSVLHGGHYPEDFALLFQMAALTLFDRGERRGRWGTLGIGIGVWAGLAFFTKPTLLTVSTAIAATLVLRTAWNSRWNRLVDLGWMALGFGSTSAVILGYFSLQGAWTDITLAYAYNQAYTSLGLLERGAALLETLKWLFSSPGLSLVFAAWLASLGALILQNGEHLAGWMRKSSLGYWSTCLGIILFITGLGADLFSGSINQGMGLGQWMATGVGVMLIAYGWLHIRGVIGRRPAGWLESHRIKISPEKLSLLGVAVLCFPLEIGMISLSARNYVYYFIALVPTAYLLLAALADHLLQPSRSRRALVLVWILSLLTAVISGPLLEYPALFRRGTDPDLVSTVAYIQKNTVPSDFVLTWGASPYVNYYSGRPAPSKFVYKYPFFQEDLDTQQRSARFLNDLHTHQPALIVDTMNDSLPFIGIPGTDSCIPSGKLVPDHIQSIFGYLCQNYHQVEILQPGGWRIFRVNGK